MTGVDVTFIVLGLTLATALLAPRLPIPALVVCAAVGIGVGTAWHLVPALPAIRMPPDLVLLIFLPPPADDRRVRVTAAGVPAQFAADRSARIWSGAGHDRDHRRDSPRLRGPGLGAAFVLGAILAPPDPVAATAVAGKTGLSHRLGVILEGEGLVNDAVAIVAYGIALAALRTGQFDATGAMLVLLQ